MVNPGYENRLKQAVDAMYNHQRVQAARRVGEIDLLQQRYVKVFSSAMEESDRAASILIFAYIEDCLVSLIARHFDPAIATTKSLTAPNGLLNTSSARITLVAGLGWILKPTYDALNIIKKVRNKFAHHVEIESYENAMIKGMIASIPPFEKEVVDSLAKPTEPRKFDTRELFFLRSSAAVHLMHVEGAVLPLASEYKVSPRDIIGPWDEGPKNLSEISRASARIACHLYDSGSTIPMTAEDIALAGTQKIATNDERSELNKK